MILKVYNYLSSITLCFKHINIYSQDNIFLEGYHSDIFSIMDEEDDYYENEDVQLDMQTNDIFIKLSCY